MDYRYQPRSWATDDNITPRQLTALSYHLDNEENANTVQADRIDTLSAGITTIPRWAATGTGVSLGASQRLHLSYFTADSALTVTSSVVRGGSVAAGATPTLARWGLYSVASNGDLTLVASIANDTTLFSAANTVYTRSLSASYGVVLGQRYAFGILVVSSAGIPSVMNVPSQIQAAELAVAPRLAGIVNSQTDLPSSITAASVSNTAVGPYYARFS